MVLIEKLKNRDWMAWFYVRLIVIVAKNRPKILDKFIQDCARNMASQIAMGVLDQEGISHCIKCPRRFGMRRVGKEWLCQAHITETV